MTSDVMFADKFLMSDVLDKSDVDWVIVFVFHISSHFRTKIG